MRRNTIALRGDVLLRVADSLELLVSSQFLKFGSRAFQAMLESNFVEGRLFRARNPRKPFVLELPEDEPYAMCDLCILLHRSEELDPDRRAPESFLELFKVADKYDCMRSVRPGVLHWMRRNCIKAADQTQRLKWVTLAYLFDDAETFSRMTSGIVQANRPSCSLYSLFQYHEFAVYFPKSLLGKSAMVLRYDQD